MSHIGISPELRLDALDQRLLNDYQQRFPLTPEPFRDLAETLDIPEAEVLDRLTRLQTAGLVSRIGPVLRPHRAGVSTLAALAVPPERLDAVVTMVNQFVEINHNYEREHRYNLWFVVTAPQAARLHQVLDEIERLSGLPVLNLPLEEDYFIDLGFELRWN